MKKIVIIVVFLFVLPIVAQKEKATLYFKDGTALKGLAKITNSDKIKFRKGKGSKKQIFDGKTVRSVIIKRANKDIEYVFKKVKKKNVQLLKVVEKGKINLYEKITSGYTAGMPMAGGGMSSGQPYSISNYYVSRNDDNNADFLTSTGLLFGKSFKKTASEYFKDCPELVKKIQNKVYKKRDIEEIIQFYNGICFGKQLTDSPIKIDSLGLHIKDKYRTIEVPNKSADEIFGKMIEYITKNNDSIIDKKESEYLKFQVTNHYISYLTRKGKDGHIGHKSSIEMDFIDSKCIIKSINPEFYLIFGPISEQPKFVKKKRKKPFVVYGKGASLYDNNMILSKPGIMAKPKMEAYFNNLINNISDFLNQKDD